MGRGDRSRSRGRRSPDRRGRSRDAGRRDRSGDRKDEGRDRPGRDGSRGRNDAGPGDRDKRDRSRDRGSRKEDKPVEEEKDDDEYRPGRRVIIKGLQKNPEKNGSIGKLVDFNKEKGRWKVEFSSGDHNFKEENLELMPDNSDVLDEKEDPPTSKIYIQNLAAETTDQDLIKLFGGVGVIAKEPPKNARFKGFKDQWPPAVKLYKPGKASGDGCVVFEDPFAAKAAILNYNRYKLNGSKIKVSYAGQGRKYRSVELTLPWHLRPENAGKLNDGDSGGGGGGGGGGGKGGGKPGDWTCPMCAADNFASRDVCFKCQAAKP